MTDFIFEGRESVQNLSDYPSSRIEGKDCQKDVGEAVHTKNLDGLFYDVYDGNFRVTENIRDINVNVSLRPNDNGLHMDDGNVRHGLPFN